MFDTFARALRVFKSIDLQHLSLLFPNDLNRAIEELALNEHLLDRHKSNIVDFVLPHGDENKQFTRFTHVSGTAYRSALWDKNISTEDAKKTQFAKLAFEAMDYSHLGYSFGAMLVDNELVVGINGFTSKGYSTLPQYTSDQIEKALWSHGFWCNDREAFARANWRRPL